MDAAGREQPMTTPLQLRAAARPSRRTLSANEHHALITLKANRETASSIPALNWPRFINIHFSNREPLAIQSVRPSYHDSRVPGSDHQPGLRSAVRNPVELNELRKPERAVSARCWNTNHESRILTRGPQNAPRFGVVTRNSHSGDSTCNSLKTLTRACPHPERPAASVFSHNFRPGNPGLNHVVASKNAKIVPARDDRPGSKIRLPFGNSRPTIRVAAGAGPRRNLAERIATRRRVGWSSSLSPAEGGLP